MSARPLRLARYRGRGKGALETLLSLPLVLPPTAVGLLLLELLARGAAGTVVGRARHGGSVHLESGAGGDRRHVVPVARPLGADGIEEVDPQLVGIARTLGCGPLAAFFRVSLPLAWRGVLAGTVLAFSRALGEFGATIMVAGNIPGKTQTLALAIFHDSQIGRDDRALVFAGVTVGPCLRRALAPGWLTRRRGRRVDA